MRLNRAVLHVTCGLALMAAPSESTQTAQVGPSGQSSSVTRDLSVTVGKSLVVESPVNIQRISIANEALAEAVAVTPRELLVNGKSAGETSLIVWQQGGARLLFDLHVRENTARIEAVRQELKKELGNQDVSFTLEQGNVFLRGTVDDVVNGERAASIVATLGKPVNLLNVKVPAAEEQVLLKVRFANVDRSATSELATNFLYTGSANESGSIHSGITTSGMKPITAAVANQKSGFALTDALNIFLFRRDPNFGAILRALQAKRLLEILAEPNVLAMNGKPASFLAGGEVPIPTVQSTTGGGAGGGAGAITIQYREFGVRLNFLPQVTARGAIRLQVMPEVSSLDYSNAVVLNGFTIPAISTRRVQTEVELEDGQTFAIAGLLDNWAIEDMTKIPGLGDIPLLGKLFQSRKAERRNTELLILVTPELVRPIPAGQPVPEVRMPMSFHKDSAEAAPRTPPMSVTGPVPQKRPRETVPLEQMNEREVGEPSYQALPVQIVPVPMPQSPPQNGAGAPARPQQP